MINLEDAFNVKKGDIISITGSGGKTSLLFAIAKELRNKYRVLVSTSAKMAVPSEEEYDYIYTSAADYVNDKSRSSENGITIVAGEIDKNRNKVIGINDEELNYLLKSFDIVLLEADGSRRMPLKGWKSYEPPILVKTNKVIGIIPVDVINSEVSEDNIYGFDEFRIMTDYSRYVDFEAIGKICSNENGLFKNSRGKLYLYLNKVDTEEEIILTSDLITYLKTKVVGNPFEFKICAGSLKKGVYYEC